MNLFQTGNFTLASGQQSQFKIDADALTDEDIAHVRSCLYIGFQHSVPLKGFQLVG